MVYSKGRDRLARVLEALFNREATKWKATVNRSTDLHLHVSPVMGSFTLWDVKRITKAVVYFDDALTQNLPSSRSRRYMVEPHRQNEVLGQLHTMHAVFFAIDQCQDFLELSATVCAGDMPYGSRYYHVNFTNLAVENKPKTIEFRYPPACDNWQDVDMWLTRILNFTMASFNTVLDPDQEGNWEAYLLFVQERLE